MALKSLRLARTSVASHQAKGVEPPPFVVDDSLIPENPPQLHSVVYGETGLMKSTFAETFVKASKEKPQLVLLFDPPDKATPYHRRCVKQPAEDYLGIGLRADDVFGKDGRWLRRIEYFEEPRPEQPSAYRTFVQRALYLYDEAAAGDWGSVVLDSTTYMAHAYGRFAVAVNPNRYSNSPMTPPDARLIGLDTKTEFLGQLMARFAWLPTNVVILGHVADKKDEFGEGLLRGINLPGTLKGDLPTGYGETYHAFVSNTKTATGDKQCLLQTKHDGLWYANSVVLNAPNPCYPDYACLWANWEKD